MRPEWLRQGSNPPQIQ